MARRKRQDGDELAKLFVFMITLPFLLLWAAFGIGEHLHRAGIPRFITYLVIAVLTFGICGYSIGFENLDSEDFLAVGGIIGVLSLMALLFGVARQGSDLPAVDMSHVDIMTGPEFERFLQAMLTHRGYRVHNNRGSNDFGVDLIADDGANRTAIQAKRSAGRVSRRAISDAVAGMHHYACNQAMVVTNSRFTRSARSLAESTDCRLVDRDELRQWIAELSGNAEPDEGQDETSSEVASDGQLLEVRAANDEGDSRPIEPIHSFSQPTRPLRARRSAREGGGVVTAIAGLAGAFLKSALRSLGTQVGRSVKRGTFGTMLRSTTKPRR